MGCHALLQGNFPTWGSNFLLLHLLHFQWIVYPLSHQGSPVACCIGQQRYRTSLSLQKVLLGWRCCQWERLGPSPRSAIHCQVVGVMPLWALASSSVNRGMSLGPAWRQCDTSELPCVTQTGPGGLGAFRKSFTHSANIPQAPGQAGAGAARRAGPSGSRGPQRQRHTREFHSHQAR